MSGQQVGREAGASGRAGSAGGRNAAPAGRRVALWEMSVLFHCSTRYPRRSDLPRVDRLAGILRRGLVAPGCCEEGSVRSDLRLTVTGTDVPYETLVFLHRFGPESYIYTMHEPGRFAVFLDPALPVLTQDAMGERWVVLCQDEVYVRERVAVEHVTGVAVHPADVETVLRELLGDFRRAGIPLYDYEGNVCWEPE